LSSTGAGDRRKTILHVGLIFVLSSILWVFTTHFRYSFTNSCGAHFFWKTDCPEPLFRNTFVSFTPRPNPILPEYVHSLIKRIFCLPGESVVRKELHYWCRANGMFIDMGKTKLKSRKGKPVTPFLYDRHRNHASYVLEDGEFFVVGLPVPDSYDSRYFGPIPKERIEGCYIALF